MGFTDAVVPVGEAVGLKIAMSNPYVAAAAAAWLIGDYLYNYYTQTAPEPPKPSDRIALPVTTVGSPVPIIYGRYRVKSPVLAWNSAAAATVYNSSLGNAEFTYSMSMLFCVGYTFREGRNKVLEIYFDDTRGVDNRSTTNPAYPTQYVTDLKGDGGHENPASFSHTQSVPTATYDESQTGGTVELLNGHSTQHIFNPDGTSNTLYGDAVLYNGEFKRQTPNYYGMLSLFLSSYVPNYVNGVAGPSQTHLGFLLGTKATIPKISFEVETRPASIYEDYVLPGAVDVNPITCMIDLLTDSRKLGNLPSRLDMVGFHAAELKVMQEGILMSRAYDTRQPASDLINEILSLVDGIFYEDPADGRYYIRLIRPDYDPSSIRQINPSNCESVEQFAAPGQYDLPNQVSITYSSRGNAYESATVSQQSQGLIYGTDGDIRDVTVQLPCLCDDALAPLIAERETHSRCMPLIKCAVIVNRSFYTARPGDAVKLVWPEANISSMVFRVVNVSRGTLQDGKIRMNLIQDYFYQWKNNIPTTTGIINTGMSTQTV